MTAWVHRLALALAAVAGCHQQPALLPPVVEVTTPELPPEPPWPGTLALVLTAIDSGRFTAADSILTTFEQSEVDTPAVRESSFWRALIRADPRNPAFSPAGAKVALEAYVAASNGAHRAEATVLLRHLAISDSLRVTQAAARAAAEKPEK